MKLFGAASKDPSVKVEHEEWKKKSFVECDKDKDGRHNLDEFKAYMKMAEERQVLQLGSAMTWTDDEYE